MAFKAALAAILLLVLLNVTICAGVEKLTRQKRKSKELEDRISDLDEGTKRRIGAMKAAGMPKEAIAEKIAYEAGGKGTAKRIVDALVDEPVKLKTKPKTTTKNANANNQKNAAKKTQQKKSPVKPQAGKSRTSQKNKKSGAGARRGASQGFRNEL